MNSPAEQMSLDAFAARVDDLHEMSDRFHELDRLDETQTRRHEQWCRFHEAADLVTQDSADLFGDEPDPGLMPEQWAARLVIVTAFAQGKPVYVEESNRGQLYWKRLDKASFLGPVESYSLDPERSHFPKP